MQATFQSWRRAAIIALAVTTTLLAVNRGVWGEDEKPTPVVHVVLFTFKPDAPADLAERMIADAHKLLGAIDVVQEVRVGRKAAEDRPVHLKDYDVAMVLVLTDLEALPKYQDDPLHVEFANRYRSHIAPPRVIDFFGATP